MEGEVDTSDQIEAVRHLLEHVLGPDLVGVWLHGSAVLDELRPSSDIDLLALVRADIDDLQRRALLAGLLEASMHPDRPGAGRPVELTVVARPDLVPWRYPPTAAFQYGEWERDQYEAGNVPAAGPSPDLALLIEVARRSESSLIGPPPEDVLPAVPAEDLRRAARDGVPALLADLETDTRNVLLTLARVVTTLETGRIDTKHAAARYLLTRVPAQLRPVLAAARDDYLGVAPADWSVRSSEASALAAWCRDVASV